MSLATMELTKTDAVDIFRKMFRIRRFETKVIDLFQDGRIRGSTHTYIGEEASGVGTCSALRQDDYITSTHRGHGHCVAKGGRMDFMMAELLGTLDRGGAQDTGRKYLVAGHRRAHDFRRAIRTSTGR